MLSRLRSMSVYMAVVSIIYMVAIRFVDIGIGKWDIFVELLAGVLITFGILTDTGKDAQPISKESILEKLKSPVAVNSIFSLLVFIIYDCSDMATSNIIIEMLSTILFVFFGVAVGNNPNSRDSFI